jgi:hypothetical protein
LGGEGQELEPKSQDCGSNSCELRSNRGGRPDNK